MSSDNWMDRFMALSDLLRLLKMMEMAAELPAGNDSFRGYVNRSMW